MPDIQENVKAHYLNPVAEVVSKHGDPEIFGEREIKVVTDIQVLPYGVKLYPLSPELCADACMGAVMLGARGQRPEPGHWLEPFYVMGEAEAKIKKNLVEALKRIAAVPGCGCSHPCRCDIDYSVRIELEARMDLAAEALAAYEGRGEL